MRILYIKRSFSYKYYRKRIKGTKNILLKDVVARALYLLAGV